MKSDGVSLPAKGIPKAKLLKMMQEFRGDDANYMEGKTWSLVYHLGEEHTKFLQDAYTMYFSENGLNPMAFHSLKRFESETIRMTAKMLNGDEDTVGTLTSGGTESCMLAVKTARDWAKANKRLMTSPEMIVPETVHVAFEKASEYFNVKAVHAPLTKDGRVDVKAVKRRINRNTCLIVGSAPCYPFGVIDPIEDLGAIAKKKNIPLHVDSCLGGYLLPFVEKLGYEIPPFDFRVPGVTSMSADIHKYGFSAKGASTVTYRSMDYLKHQMFVFDSWPGGIFASPALLGTRPGGSIAAAWAAMMAQGESGYMKNAKIIMDTTKKLMDGVNSIEGLEVVGKPDCSVFAYKSNSSDVNIYAVGDQMEKRGWNIDRQQKPDALHAMVTPKHAEIVKIYLKDLKDSVAVVKANPELATQGGAAMYGMISSIPLRGMIKQNVLKMMMDMYSPKGSVIDPSAATDQDDLATKAGVMFLKLKQRLTKELERLR